MPVLGYWCWGGWEGSGQTSPERNVVTSESPFLLFVNNYGRFKNVQAMGGVFITRE